jgi:hypothetical protein
MIDIRTMDPHIVLSLVNTRLRDGGKDIDGLCEEMDVRRPQLDAMLAGIGYAYDSGSVKYVPAPVAGQAESHRK